ncbi:hypothetical protein ABVT39_017351 [Epinephelus coioides]
MTAAALKLWTAEAQELGTAASLELGAAAFQKPVMAAVEYELGFAAARAQWITAAQPKMVFARMLTGNIVQVSASPPTVNVEQVLARLPTGDQ